MDYLLIFHLTLIFSIYLCYLYYILETISFNISSIFSPVAALHSSKSNEFTYANDYPDYLFTSLKYYKSHLFPTKYITQN
jgi:hypothetical protein